MDVLHSNRALAYAAIYSNVFTPARRPAAHVVSRVDRAPHTSRCVCAVGVCQPSQKLCVCVCVCVCSGKLQDRTLGHTLTATSNAHAASPSGRYGAHTQHTQHVSDLQDARPTSTVGAGEPLNSLKATKPVEGASTPSRGLSPSVHHIPCITPACKAPLRRAEVSLHPCSSHLFALCYSVCTRKHSLSRSQPSLTHWCPVAPPRFIWHKWRRQWHCCSRYCGHTN